MNTEEGYSTLEQESVPKVPAFSPDYSKKDNKTSYYKLLSKEYKEENEDLYKSGKDILHNNTKLKKKNKVLLSGNDELIRQNNQLQKELEKSQKKYMDTNLSLLEEMEKNAVLENQVLLLQGKLEKHNYCYIPKKFPKK